MKISKPIYDMMVKCCFKVMLGVVTSFNLFMKDLDKTHDESKFISSVVKNFFDFKKCK